MDDLVLVSDMSQFKNVYTFINTFDDMALRRHLSWLFVQAYGSVANPKAVVLVIQGSENHAKQERPRFCAAQAESSYRLLAAAMASVGLFSEEERRRISDHLTSIVKKLVRYRITNQLDKGINPCDDFGAHVCGRWMPRKERSLSRSEMSDMYLSWLYGLPERLNKGFRQFRVVKKVAVMYNMCMRQEGSQIDMFKEFMRARGIIWPEKQDEPVPLVKALSDLAFNWNVNLWFSVKLLPSISKEKPRHIFLAPNELMLLWKATFSQMSKENFQIVYSELFKIFSNGTSSQPNPKIVSATYTMLDMVFNAFVPLCPCEARIPGLFPLRAIDSNSRIPIGSHLMETLNNATGIEPPVTMDDLVLVSDMSQFKNVYTFINTFDDMALRRHLSWLFVQAYGSVANPKAVVLVIQGSENHAKQERPRFCAAQAESSYRLLAAAMASVGLFSEEERRRISDHLTSIVKEAVEKTWAISWLDNETKQVAVEKFRNVRTVLWPSNQFLKAEALRKVYANFTDNAKSFTEYWIETRRSQRLMFGSEAAEEELLLGDSTQLPYAEFEHVLNRLSLSLGALASPLYYKNGTNAMLHGGLLYFYARALIAAIDSEGVKIDPQGKLVSSWLSQSVQDTFVQRTLSCLPGNASIFPEVPAMEVAYAAFNRHHQEHNIRLSEDLTEEKVFFITACLATCATTPADNLYGGDCNKAVMNFAPFAKAFNCPAGSKMNPASKCTFYD
ncbi:endothelin-converting enzyme 1 [Dermacentor silvarum]|uniref:endothelin-converting enzyme 1 n=1 Tax=Dermacentor silvarum TaxID=543639 RepID=UPI00189C32A0|nr:endothelin-converting enzyme 1 [Dermacentor silvarum]